MIRPLFIAAALVLLAGCGNRTEPATADQSIRSAKVIVVRAPARVTTHEFVARVEAAQSIDLSFEVDGVLAQLPVREGQTVERGQLVAALDPTDFRLAVREAELEVQLASQDLERKRRLLAQKGIAVSLVEDAQSMLELQQVRLEQRRESLAKSELHSPLDAEVAMRYLDNHAQISATDPVVRLHELHELQVVASIPERLVVSVDMEQVVSMEAVFPSAPERRFPVTFRENRGEADAVAQTYEVSFSMRRPEDINVLPGMTAAVRVGLSPPADALSLPRLPATALVVGADKRFFVWVVEPQSRTVRRQPVEVGAPDAAGIPVLSGIEEGVMVVAAGARQLQEGMRIRPIGADPNDP